MKYVCVMFPYPSGDLHVGHWYNYAITDSYCRYLRYNGEEVFQPFGWDAFGLPAENAARKLGKTPKEVTDACIDRMRHQINKMNTQYRELLSTTDESYQQKTQELFIRLKNKQLAYKSIGIQQYCPSCQTVLAREQVVQGTCERCGATTEQKELEQWYFAITKYKDRLVDNIINGKSGLPTKTANAQLKWLDKLHDWCVSRQRPWGCPIPIAGETDTLDTFVDSSFYFIEYCVRANLKPQPVDIYIGGNEHACMHLIYARFITMFLYDEGMIDFEEPFKRVVHQGMILKDGQKMSKSKGNVVNLDMYNSDEIRFYLMFIGHYFDGGSWSDKDINGIKRFIHKMHEWMEKTGNDTVDIINFKQIIFDYTESFKFNKVVSSFMILLNENKHKSLTIDTKEQLIQLLEIYMPSIRTTLRF